MVRPQESSWWIESAPEDGDGPRIAVEDPATGEVLVHPDEAGPSEGATVACGGRRIAEPALAGGHFVPTVLLGVDNAMRVAREEVRSGIGREKGLEALRHFTRTKSVIAHVDDRV